MGEHVEFIELILIFFDIILLFFFFLNKFDKKLQKHPLFGFIFYKKYLNHVNYQN